MTDGELTWCSLLATGLPDPVLPGPTVTAVPTARNRCSACRGVGPVWWLPKGDYVGDPW